MIVDSSGSMAARIGNETRLDAARRVLLDQVAGWKPDARLALVAYGHRRESDCRDIETIIPLGAIDLATTKRRLAELRARGRTPLSASLRHAAGTTSIQSIDSDPPSLRLRPLRRSGSRTSDGLDSTVFARVRP